MPKLADEIRQTICDQVSRTGGHLAPNLGVVDLTMHDNEAYFYELSRLAAPATC